MRVHDGGGGVLVFSFARSFLDSERSSGFSVFFYQDQPMFFFFYQLEIYRVEKCTVKKRKCLRGKPISVNPGTITIGIRYPDGVFEFSLTR